MNTQQNFNGHHTTIKLTHKKLALTKFTETLFIFVHRYSFLKSVIISFQKPFKALDLSVEVYSILAIDLKQDGF